jgi:hypothetical protein
MKRLVVAALVGALAIGVAGCSNVTAAFDSLTGQSQSQVTTFADAESAATVATNAVDVYVNSASPDRATLTELKALNDGVHAALTDLQHDQTAGNSLTFGAFNAALDAFDAYATSNGVSTS